MTAFADQKADTVKFDRSVQGRPFDLGEIFGEIKKEAKSAILGEADPIWYKADFTASDTVYFGIGKSTQSAEEADGEARLKFAQHVAVKVQSIATQQINENQERLEENYNFESLVATDMTLRSVNITERYISLDSTYFSLIRYGKSAYHDLVTQEIQIALAANIRKQELAHQATEALRADSLRHKLAMDSLVLGRKQAVIDSLDATLKLEEASIRQEQDKIDLIKSRYAAFLNLKPHHLLIDIPSAKTPESWIHGSGRWEFQEQHIRQLNVGASLSLLTAEVSVWGTESLANQAEASVRLEVLPSRGEVYPVQLALGYVSYISAFSESAAFDLREPDKFGSLSDQQLDAWRAAPDQSASFLAVGTVGIPKINSHVTGYWDNRKVSLGSIWYPFPRNMGDAISIINQIDVIQDENYRNPHGDQIQWQVGLRLIAISDRFATMISYEDHQVWMLNFELQY